MIKLLQALQPIILIFIRGKVLMKILQQITNSLLSLVDNIGRIFKPNDDHYPATGVVPYTGDAADH